MRVLVTGASGMIGSSLSEALLARGDDVVGLTRNPESARAEMTGLEWHQWSPDRAQPAPMAFQGIDAIVNLAGERIDQRRTDAARRRIMNSRRNATLALAQAVARMAEKPSVVVSGSAVGYYGFRGDEALDERSASGLEAETPGVEAGFDTEVVVAWERAAEGFANVGTRLVTLRSGPVLDPSGGMLGRLLPAFRLGLGGPVAGGDQYVSWIHIADEVGIILWALDNPKVAGAINATSPNPVTNRALARSLGKALRRPAVLPLPGFVVDFLFGRELAATVKYGQRVLPQRALALGYEFRHPEIHEALTDLLRRR